MVEIVEIFSDAKTVVQEAGNSSDKDNYISAH
jgi:hypothetical protein